MKRIESIKVTAAALSMVVALTACATKGSEDNGTAEGTQAVATRETDIIVDVAQTTDTDTQTTEDTTGNESVNAILTESGIILELEGGFTATNITAQSRILPSRPHTLPETTIPPTAI